MTSLRHNRFQASTTTMTAVQQVAAGGATTAPEHDWLRDGCKSRSGA